MPQSSAPAADRSGHMDSPVRVAFLSGPFLRRAGAGVVWTPRIRGRALLFDGDTGWHIRTGELILQSGTVPRLDPFSFSRPDQTWFAWEWLADVIFARFHAWGGLEAVAAFTVVALCASGALLLCWLLRRGVGLWIALGVTLACHQRVHHPLPGAPAHVLAAAVPTGALDLG